LIHHEPVGFLEVSGFPTCWAFVGSTHTVSAKEVLAVGTLDRVIEQVEADGALEFFGQLLLALLDQLRVEAVLFGCK